MSLVKLPSFAGRSNNLRKPQRGEVIDNNDPEKLGRVKVKIKGMLEGDTENLPWVYPNNPNGHGGSNKSAHHKVPKVGSNLMIEFREGNIYAPMYTGTAHSKNNFARKKFEKNYPNTYGWQDAGGNSLVHDEIEGTMEYSHVAQYKDTQKESGSESSGPDDGVGSSDEDNEEKKPTLHFKISKDGTFAVTSEKDGKVTTKGDVNVSTDGNTNLAAKKNLSMSTDQNASLTAKEKTNVTSSSGTTVSSSSNTKVRGSKVFLN